MTVVSTEDTEMDGLMMTFGSIGTGALVETACCGGEDITVTTALESKLLLGMEWLWWLVMVQSLDPFYNSWNGFYFNSISMAIIKLAYWGYSPYGGPQYSLEKPTTVLLPTNLEGQDDTDYSSTNSVLT